MTSNTARDRAWGYGGALREKWQREAIARDGSLADTLYSPVLDKGLLRDSERGCVSPLAGVAKPAGKR